MKIAICGITGLTGRATSQYFTEMGYKVLGIGRSDLGLGIGNLQQMLAGVDALINLAGAPILKRWTPKWKDEIYNSRIETTRLLVTAMNGMSHPPKMFISSSAVGIYDDKNSHNESSENFSDNFLAHVCKDWEAEAIKVKPPVRLCIFRLGVVLSTKGGALQKMILPFKLGVGGTIGSGKQYFPFVDISDVTRSLKWALDTESAHGVYNLVAPQIITNKYYATQIANWLHRPAFFPIPVIALRLLFGKASKILISGQRVHPERLLNQGFVFQFPTLELALQSKIQ
jgi:uncharacterized protein (TIGR01777 family)